jgi:hypothetical protein
MHAVVEPQQQRSAAPLTITGRTIAAANSITVAIVTDRSIRLPSGLFGRGAVPLVAVIA